MSQHMFPTDSTSDVESVDFESKSREIVMCKDQLNCLCICPLLQSDLFQPNKLNSISHDKPANSAAMIKKPVQFDNHLHFQNNWSPILPQFDMDLGFSPRKSQSSQFSNSMPSPTATIASTKSSQLAHPSYFSNPVLMDDSNLPSLHLDTNPPLTPTRGRRRRREPFPSQSFSPAPSTPHQRPRTHTYASHFLFTLTHPHDLPFFCAIMNSLSIISICDNVCSRMRSMPALHAHIRDNSASCWSICEEQFGTKASVFLRLLRLCVSACCAAAAQDRRHEAQRRCPGPKRQDLCLSSP